MDIINESANKPTYKNYQKGHGWHTGHQLNLHVSGMYVN